MRRAALLLIAALAAGALSCAPSGARSIAAEFADVGDLVGRANVQQSDAVVGTVSSIELVDRGGRWLALVKMRLKDDTRVPRGTRAIVRSTSLLGEKYVDLVPPQGSGPDLPDGAVIGVEATDKSPELEDLFSRLGAILQGGALEDLARLSTAGAMILEGQEEATGRVLDGTAKLVASLAREREALAAGIDDLASASRTLAGGSQTITDALGVSAQALRIVADQRSELEDLVVSLDRLAAPLGDLTREHKDDVDAQVRALNTVVPQLYAARDALRDAVEKLPEFTKLFARSIPGDYVQLNAVTESLPVQLPAALAGTAAALLLEAAR